MVTALAFVEDLAAHHADTNPPTVTVDAPTTHGQYWCALDETVHPNYRDHVAELEQRLLTAAERLGEEYANPSPTQWTTAEISELTSSIQVIWHHYTAHPTHKRTFGFDLIESFDDGVGYTQEWMEEADAAEGHPAPDVPLEVDEEHILDLLAAGDRFESFGRTRIDKDW